MVAPIKVETVIVKVASRCDLDCDYCYVFNSVDHGWERQPALMSDETVSALIDRLMELERDQEHGIAVVIHGGEPLLLPLPRLTRLVEGLKASLGPSSSISVQSNGQLLTKSHVDLFGRLGVHFALSLDGPQEIHDRHRRTARGEASFDKTIAALRAIQENEKANAAFGGLLAVVDPDLKASDSYAFFKSLGVKSVDYLLPDGNWDRLPSVKRSVDDLSVGHWMRDLWAIYTQDDTPYRIEFLDNFFRALLRQPAPNAREGVGSKDYGILIVDTDGSVAMNDTLKSSFDGADRFREDWSIEKGPLVDIAASEDFSSYVAAQRPSSVACQSCPILHACGGGMLLQRWASHNSYENPSIYCEDFKVLAAAMIQDLEELSQC